MWFLWGFLMFFLCHTALHIFLIFAKKYYLDKKSVYLYNALGVAVFWIGALIFGLSVIGSTAAILVGNAIGFITGYIHFNAKQRAAELEKKLTEMQVEKAVNDFLESIGHGELVQKNNEITQKDEDDE